MSDHVKTPAEKTTSPKVIASSLTALGLALILGAISAVTPELFEFLGALGPVAYAAVIAAGAHLAGYVTRDPLRG